MTISRVCMDNIGSILCATSKKIMNHNILLAEALGNWEIIVDAIQ